MPRTGVKYVEKEKVNFLTAVPNYVCGDIGRVEKG